MMILLYTTNDCPYCHAAKDLLKSKGSDFDEVDGSEDADFEALVKRTGWKTVPQIFIGDTFIGGFRELADLDRNGSLDEMIKKS